MAGFCLDSLRMGRKSGQKVIILPFTRSILFSERWYTQPLTQAIFVAKTKNIGFARA